MAMPITTTSLNAMAHRATAPVQACSYAADVCLLLEGTYPYVAGGVSSWVHQLIRGLPDLRFVLFHIGPTPDAYGAPRYPLPANVTGLRVAYCQGGPSASRESGGAAGPTRPRPRSARAGGSRVLRALRQLHLGAVDDQLVADLASADLPVSEFLHGRAAFDLACELAERLAPERPFLDLFWHFRAMHVPLLRLLSETVPDAALYHAPSAGYAGLLGAVASVRTGRPFLLTEHGLYSRERDIELARASWIQEEPEHGALGRLAPAATSPLRALWSRFFHAMGRVAYQRARRIVSLSEGARRKQVADGAPAAVTCVIPNGVDVDRLGHLACRPKHTRQGPLRVGFVGRVVPIKDVVTFIKACDRALRQVTLEARIIGPDEEAPHYAQRCRSLVALLAHGSRIRFVGPQPIEQIYDAIDLIVLTSFSEGQPLVVLEAQAAGLPAIATDVGACRELLEGRTAADRRLGPSGLVTPIANPRETAEAMVALGTDLALRHRFGAAGRERVTAFYRDSEMLLRYRELYREP